MFAFHRLSFSEIATDVFRFCLYAPEIDLQFNFFLVRDEQPPLFTTGDKSSFPLLQEVVVQVIDPAEIRWVAFSHFESDECGALNLWLDAAPRAEPVCSLVSAMVNVNDFAVRTPKTDAMIETLGRESRAEILEVFGVAFSEHPLLPP